MNLIKEFCCLRCTIGWLRTSMRQFLPGGTSGRDETGHRDGGTGALSRSHELDGGWAVPIGNASGDATGRRC